jgi:hypothetical protein
MGVREGGMNSRGTISTAPDFFFWSSKCFLIRLLTAKESICIKVYQYLIYCLIDWKKLITLIW